VASTGGAYGRTLSPFEQTFSGEKVKPGTPLSFTVDADTLTAGPEFDSEAVGTCEAEHLG